MGIDKKKAFDEVNRMMLMAKAKAYSKVSLQRPLTDSEAKAYKAVMKELGFI